MLHTAARLLNPRPPVLRGRHPVFHLKGFGKDERVSIAAGQRHALHGEICYEQKLRRPCEPVIRQILLRRYIQLTLKERVQIAPVDTHVVRNICDADRITEVILDILHCFPDVQASASLFPDRHHIKVLRESSKERVQEPFQHELVRCRVRIMAEHLAHGLLGYGMDVI